MEKQYLTTKDLAYRYALKPATIKSWRDKTKAGNKTGPTWEEAHNITPIHSF